MNVKNVFKNFFYLDEEEEEINDREYIEARDNQIENARQQKQMIKHNQQQQQMQMAKQQKRGRNQQNQNERQPMATPVPSTSRPQRKSNKQMPTVIENNYSNTPNLLNFTNKKAKVILFEPRVYAEAQDIGECLKNKKAAVVNLQRIDNTQGKRIIDFLSGTIFALNGDIKKIGEDIFLCTPDNVEVDGTISEYFDE